MGLLDRLKRNIFTCTEEDYDDLTRFFRDHYRIWVDHTVLNFSRWQWMFTANPNAHHPCVWIFKKNNEILAHQASIPFLMKVGNDYCRSAWGVKVMVDTDYQNRGIGTLLTKKWTADVDVAVALGVGDEAYRMYKSAGWIDLGRMTSFVKLLDAEYIIQRHIPTGAASLARIIAGIVNFCLNLRDHIRSPRSRGSLCVERVDRFDQEMDELWDRASVYYDVIAKRDSVYLSWKYANEPDLPYSLLRFSLEDRVVGYAVLTVSAEDGICAGHIIDFLAEPHHVKCIMARIVLYFRNQKVQKVYLRILCKRLEAVLRKIGFHRRGRGARIMVNQRNDRLELVGDPSKWFATLGDGDLTEGILSIMREG